MRRSFKGAAAVAALCAGALTMTSVAVANLTAPRGSGSDASDVRVSGDDRIQTSIEALADHGSKGPLNIMIVGYQGVVDALSLPPLVEKYGDAAILYSDRNGLDDRVLDALNKRKARIQHIFISGGFGAVPEVVYSQLFSKDMLGNYRVLDPNNTADTNKVVRIAGADRFETAYLTAALAKDSTGKLFAKLQMLNGIQRTKAEFDQIKANYYKAKAALAAAEAAKASADAAVKTTYAAYEVERAKTSDNDLNTASAQFNGTKAAFQQYENAKDKANTVTAQMDILKKGAEAFRQDAWKNVTLGELAQFASAHKLSGLLGAINTVKRLASGPLTNANTVGEAAKRAQSDLATAVQNYDQHFTSYDNNRTHLMRVIKAYQDRTNPDSAFSKAADAWSKAVAAQAKANTDLANARHAFTLAYSKYLQAAALLFEDVQENLVKKAVDSQAASVFAPGDFPIFLATGMNFADALTAGPAAYQNGGVVLLSNDSVLPSYVASAIQQSTKDVYGIGGPAVQAYAKSLPVAGSDRYQTAAKVAQRFFPAKGIYALASGETGADAVTAGVYMASLSYNGNKDARGVLLTAKSYVPEGLSHFVQYGNRRGYQKLVSQFVVFGGEGVIDRAVVNEAKALTHN